MGRACRCLVGLSASEACERAVQRGEARTHMSSLVDWDVAARAAKRLSPPPPSVTRAEADAAVGELYQSISRRSRPRRRADPARGAAGHRDEPGRRPRGLDRRQRRRHAHGDDTARRQARRRQHPVGRVAEAFGGKITGAQVGVVLGFLSGKVLGQFEFFDRPGGQLLLVAPNLVARRAAAQRRPARLPALGLPARGHPPGAVHRGALAAPAHARRGRTRSTDAIDTDPAALRQPASATASASWSRWSAARATAPG